MREQQTGKEVAARDKGGVVQLFDAGQPDEFQNRSGEAGAIAQVQARTLMAVRFKNDIDVARQGILKECVRPQFAGTAMYALPRGDKMIRGLSIHYADMALQHLRNIQINYSLEADNERQRVIRVTAVNLETNSSWDELAVVDKTVERKKLRPGQVALSQRTNSYGDLVYLITADEGDFIVKMRAELAKRRRDVILRVIPEWLREESMEAIQTTVRKMADGSAPDGDKQRRKLLDRLLARGVSADQIAEYLGHPAERMTADEFAELVKIGQAIAEGSTNWDDVIGQRRTTKAARAAEANTAGSTATAAPRDDDDLKR
jgi:hypothetical protein